MKDLDYAGVFEEFGQTRNIVNREGVDDRVTALGGHLDEAHTLFIVMKRIALGVYRDNVRTSEKLKPFVESLWRIDVQSIVRFVAVVAHRGLSMPLRRYQPTILSLN